MVNDELLQFIRTQRSAGVADKDIKKALKELGGWDDGDIAEAYSRLGVGAQQPASPIAHPDAMMVSPRQAQMGSGVVGSMAASTGSVGLTTPGAQSVVTTNDQSAVTAPVTEPKAFAVSNQDTPPGEAPRVDLDQASVADFEQLSKEMSVPSGQSQVSSDLSNKKISEISSGAITTPGAASTTGGQPVVMNNQGNLGEQMSVGGSQYARTESAQPMGSIQHRPLGMSGNQSGPASGQMGTMDMGSTMASPEQNVASPGVGLGAPSTRETPETTSSGVTSLDNNTSFGDLRPSAPRPPMGQIRPGMGMQSAPVAGSMMTPGGSAAMGKPMIDTRAFGSGGVMQSSLDTKTKKASGGGWGIVVILFILVVVAGFGYWYVSSGMQGIPFVDNILGRSQEEIEVVPTETIPVEEPEVVIDRNPLVLADQIQSALATRMSSPMDLGIDLVGEGNAADLFVQYFGFSEATSTWRQNHPVDIEGTAQLNEAERAFIASLANSAEFRWQPDAVFTDVIIEAPVTMAHLQTMLERGLATAIIFANEGQIDEGRVLAENILAVGHLLTTSPTVTPWLFNTGVMIEGRALQELTTLYDGLATADTLTALNTYQNEIATIGDLWVVWAEEVSNLEQATQYLAGLQQSGLEEISLGVVDSVYADNNLDRQAVFNWFDVVTISNNPVVVGSTLWSLSVMSQVTSLPDESNQAAAALAMVGQMDSEAVQTLLAVHEAATLGELLAAR